MSGKRHSANDQQLIDAIRDNAEALGATPKEQPETFTIDIKAAPDVAVFGGSVKALGGGKVGGYLVVFGDEKTTDLTGDYFTKDTDFGAHDTTPILYHHGLDPKLGARVLGSAKTRADDVGVWLEGQLSLRDEYEKAVYSMVEAGKAGWSSGTAAHLIDREVVGKAAHIKRWPLGIDASITPTPAEPRTRAVSIKSLQVSALEKEPKAGDAMVSNASVTTKQKEEKQMDEINEVKAAVADLTKTVASLADSVKGFVSRTDPRPDQDAGGYVTDATNGATKVSVKVLPDNKPIFARPGEFFQAVRAEATKSISEETWNRLTTHQKAMKAATGLSEQVAADGGFLVGTDVSSTWLERVYSTGAILSRVSRNTLTTGSNGMKIHGVDETSRVTGSRNGGVRAYWNAEGATLTASRPKFREVNLNVNKVHVLCYATDELLADAPFLERWITNVAPDEIRFAVEDAIINGNGVGKPSGILSSNALVTQLKEAGQTATTFNLANAAKMRGRLWMGSRANAAYFCNQDVEQQIFQMQVGNFPVYMAPGSAPGQSLTGLFGFPVIPIEYAATMGTVGDAILADLSQYQVVDKGGVTAASSIHVQFLTDETAFRFTYRVDGQPLWHSALTPFKGSNTTSPFVVVETRA